MQSRIVMDVDDVISTHRDRDYANAIPNWPVIKKMRKLAAAGVDFVLFTARGQISCNGDIDRIKREKGPVLEEWLKRHEVPHSELRFGKPIGDVYVDDAAMTPDEFIDGTFVEYNGGSNEYIERLGKFVVKECKSVSAVAVRDWFDKARSYGYHTPEVYACTYSKMRMEHIEGWRGNETAFFAQPTLASDLASIALSFASIPGEYEFDVEKYKEYISTNIINGPSDEYVRIAQEIVDEIGHLIIPSFCHGDLTTMNTIIQRHRTIYMIDPVPHSEFSSYLMDLAKLRMSLNGYNELFYCPMAKEEDRKHLEVLDRMLKKLNMYELVKKLEFTCWVRLIKYRCHNEDSLGSIVNKLGGFFNEQ